MQLLYRLVILILCLNLSQVGCAQTVKNMFKAQSGSNDAVVVQPLSTDSVSYSSFTIWVKKSVKLHYHAEHTEQVYVVEGEGLMRLGEKDYFIKPGDLITIPPNTWHGVKKTGKTALKVISIQTPFFDGSDRVMKK